MEPIILAYAGKRTMTSGKWGHQYVMMEKDKQNLFFVKKLSKYDSIGKLIKVKYDGKAATLVNDDAGYVTDSDLITKWSTQQKVHEIEKEKEAAARTKHDAHIDSMIEKIKTNCASRSDRHSIALYIYHKLTT
jgi:uncharacterized membrane-anchored protein